MRELKRGLMIERWLTMPGGLVCCFPRLMVHTYVYMLVQVGISA